MQTTILGRTGLSVSVAGLGCGGHSRLGQSYGHSPQQSADVIRAALDSGVNFIDTAAVYGTEDIVALGIQGRRDEVVISTKQGIVRKGSNALGQEFLTGAEYVALIESNLRRLGTDHIDILHLHGVMADQYAYATAELVPALHRLRDQGKIRFLGLTERFIYDTTHQMLRLALKDDHFDVVMTGFNMINPSARSSVLAETQRRNVGTLIMFAVRRALSQPDNLREVIRHLVSTGAIDPALIDPEEPLGFLTRPGVAQTVIEAAYRFCRHEPGAHVVLTGTGSVGHLAENLTAINDPELPASARAELAAVFGNVDSVSGN